MKYESFLSYITKNIKSIVGRNYQVKIHKVIKNNNIELDALIITGNGNNVSPSIYLNSYYEEYLHGRTIEDIVYDIYGIYETHNSKFDSDSIFDFNFYTDFTKVKDKLFYKLVNYNLNKKLLEDVPHIKYLDLAIIFYCCIENELLGEATILVHDNHLELWNIDIDTLHSIAKKNTQRVLAPNITPMRELIRELLISQFEHDDLLPSNTAAITISYDMAADDVLDQMYGNNDSYMYILTNSSRINGAACILYKDVIKDFSDSVASDVYILPSSIHEVILIPYDNETSADELSKMVKDVNIHGVDASEVLSDNVYIYERKKDSIRICNTPGGN